MRQVQIPAGAGPPPPTNRVTWCSGWTPQADLEWIRVPPAYAHAVLEAHRRHLITKVRALELMRGRLDDADLPPLPDEDVEP